MNGIATLLFHHYMERYGFAIKAGFYAGRTFPNDDNISFGDDNDFSVAAGPDGRAGGVNVFAAFICSR